MAAVKGVYGFRVKPGRFEDWRSLSREGEKLLNRIGARNLRVFMPTAAGPETSSCYASIDFPSAEEWGKFVDAAAREFEAQTYTERMFGHLDSPAELLYSGLITEIPLQVNATATGPVMDIWLTQPRPGRFEDCVAFANDIAPRVTQQGARGVHLHQVGPAGSESGRLAYTAEYENFAAYGRTHDALATQEWQEVMRRAMGTDAPFDLVQHAVHSEILLH